MSRAITLTATVVEVTDYCTKQKIAISVIEPLPSGGTRVVLNNLADADTMRRGMKARLIGTPVVRSSLYVSRTQTPYQA